jgi:DNA-binding NarL/FixJ family response regulator
LQRLRRDLADAPIVVLSDCEQENEVYSALRAGARGFIPTSLEPQLVVNAIRIIISGSTFIPAEILIRLRRSGLSLPQTACSQHVNVEQEAPPRAVDERKPFALEHQARPVAAEHKQSWPPQQLAVLSLLIKGSANKAIAHALAMEECTVKAHVRLIMRKLSASNRTQAALSARRLGILAASDDAGVAIAS